MQSDTRERLGTQDGRVTHEPSNAVDHSPRQRSIDVDDDDSESLLGMVDTTRSNQYSDSESESDNIMVGGILNASELMDRSNYFDHHMDESITERGDDEFLRPSVKREKRVVFELDDNDFDATDMDRNKRSTLMTGSNFGLMKSKLQEEGEGDSEESSSSYHSVDVRITLDYKEDDNSVEFDDPSVIDEAEVVERKIRNSFLWAFLSLLGAKIYSTIMECLCGSSSDNVEQEIVANAVEDFTNTSTTTMSNVNLISLPGVASGAQAQ
jgi:hypothetical protein